MLPQGLEPTNENTGFLNGEEQNRSLLADDNTLPPADPTQHRHFSERLHEQGFTPAQLRLISDAMKEASLVFSSAGEVQR